MAEEINALDIVILIIYLIFLVLGAYFLTKYLSKRARQKGMKRPGGKKAGAQFKWKEGQYVSVLDRIPIDRDKSIMVVEFEGKRYLMATTGQDIKLLDKLKKEETEESEDAKAAADFDTPPLETDGKDKGGRFSARFFDSFKVVFKNYYKKDTSLFGTRLEKEMQKDSKKKHSDHN